MVQYYTYEDEYKYIYVYETWNTIPVWAVQLFLHSYLLYLPLKNIKKTKKDRLFAPVDTCVTSVYLFTLAQLVSAHILLSTSLTVPSWMYFKITKEKKRQKWMKNGKKEQKNY